MTKTILVADHERGFVDAAKRSLEREGYAVLIAYDGKEVLLKARAKPDLILLDVSLPVMSGWEIVRTLQERRQTDPIPFIFISGNGTDADEIVGLDLGAVDYIRKPISDERLTARVRAALRKVERQAAAAETGILRVEGLEIDIPRFSVRIDGNYIVFPKKEFEVLAVLATNRGSVLSRQSILSAVWGSGPAVYDRTVDVHITKIRDKLGTYGTLIETLKRVGYRFRA
jgi:two-component system alkaline phosphatase synthesis response regulator PhoP